MASTYSPSFRTELPATGDQNNTWAATFDNNWNVPIEQGISGVVSVALPDADYTLTTANAAADQARMAVIVFTGALTAQRTITAPAVPKLYILRNNTTGGKNLFLRTGSGTTNVTDTGIPQPRSAAPYSADSTTAVPQPGVIVPPNSTAYVYTDGTLFDYCVNGLQGSVSADSIVLPSPLGVTSGGTGSSTASGARGNLGLGTAAVLTASTANDPNTIVQRDASGNFSAGTITAGLSGTASTTSNAFLLGNQSPAAYELIGANSGFLSLPFSVGNPNNIDIYGLYGAGVYHIWWRLSPDDPGTDRFATIYAVGTGVYTQLNANFADTNTANYGQGIQMTGGPLGNVGIMLGFVKRSVHQ